MIIVKVELHSAITNNITLLGVLKICNDGTSNIKERGNYDVYMYRKNNLNQVLRQGKVTNYPRLSYSIFKLVCRAIKSIFPEEII